MTWFAALRSLGEEREDQGPSPGSGPFRVKRNGGLDVWPVRILGLLLIALMWEILRSNLPADVLAHWPWRLSLLGVAPTAALAGGLLALIATRRQLTLSVEPHLGWVSSRDASVILRENSAWRVQVFNSGGGRAIIERVSYRIVPTGVDEKKCDWVSVDEARKSMISLGMVEDQDFALRRLGAGAGMGVGRDYSVEVLALAHKALELVTAVDLRIRYQSATRDTYERVMTLLPRDGVPGSSTAHDIQPRAEMGPTTSPEQPESDG